MHARVSSLKVFTWIMARQRPTSVVIVPVDLQGAPKFLKGRPFAVLNDPAFSLLPSRPPTRIWAMILLALCVVVKAAWNTEQGAISLSRSHGHLFPRTVAPPL
ncbi:MAG: hypothetical protein CM15mP74_33580 [Halieaceae bacterium]|nr:MAG: hypothetical protein CM15mP74_33580 [Halieaceae bacterium]